MGKNLFIFIISVLLAASFLLGGCGINMNNNEDSANKAEPSAEPSTEMIYESTPEPTPTPTPTPEPTPTPTPTPEPTPVPSPGVWCLKELGIEDVSTWDSEKLSKGGIGYPKEEYFLNEAKEMYVGTDIAHVFSYTMPYYENYAQGYLKYGTKVSVIAEHKGWSCCIPEEGVVGWVASDHLCAYKPYGVD